MIMSSFDSANIEYPAQWHGRVIAHADQAEKVAEQLQRTLLAFGVPHAPEPGQPSKNGAYVTFAVKAVMRDRAMMAGLPEALAKIEGVRMLL
jgi:putative lipoic acid-binding regulatory protein